MTGVSLKNLLAKSKEGSFTLKFPEGDKRFICHASMAYRKAQTPMVVLAFQRSPQPRLSFAKGKGVVVIV